MKLNKKGSSYIGLIVSIIVLLAIVSIVGTFMVYVSAHKQKVIEQNEFSHQISAQISEVYSEPWVDLEKETIETKYGPIEVTYELTGETEFSTKKLDVTFSKNDIQSTYQLERSNYYE